MNRKERRAQNAASRHDDKKLFQESVSAEHSETGHDELYMVYGGKRIAYRGHPGTPDAGAWVSLDPDIEVIESDDPPDFGGKPVIEGGEIEAFPEPKGRKH